MKTVAHDSNTCSFAEKGRQFNALVFTNNQKKKSFNESNLSGGSVRQAHTQELHGAIDCLVEAAKHRVKVRCVLQRAGDNRAFMKRVN